MNPREQKVSGDNRRSSKDRRSTSSSRTPGGAVFTQLSSLPKHVTKNMATKNNTYQGEGGEKHCPKGNSMPRGENTRWATKADIAATIMDIDSTPEQLSDEFSSAESAAPPMTTLRRSQPRTAHNAPAFMNEYQLRQPARQRLVKIQPEEGQRPGAYVHQSAIRDTSDETTLEEGGIVETRVAETTVGLAGASSSSNHEHSLLSLSDSALRTPIEILSDGAMDYRNKQSRTWRFKFLVGLVVLTVVAACVGAGVAFSRSKTDKTSTNNECSMAHIELQCSNLTKSITVIPECLLKLRKELASRLPFALGMAVSEGNNQCSAENLSIFSVAFHTSNKDSLTALTNRLGLSLMFYATTGREWTKGSDWASIKPHCEWEGVSCNEHGNVMKLEMTLFNMQGKLPSRIVSLLPDLAVLSIGMNKLTGTLPPELSQLHELDAQKNSLTGTLEAEFFASTSLHVLDLSLNSDLTINPIPFVGTQWEVLHLSSTAVDGDFLSNVSVLSNLETLALVNTNLDGTLPTEIGQLTSLTDLNLGANLLHGVIPTELQNLTKLQFLRLSNCIFSGTIPSQLGKLSKLRTLDVGANILTGGMPGELGRLKRLTSLLFYGNKLGGTIPSEVCALKINGDLLYLGTRTAGFTETQLGESLPFPYGGLICPNDEQPGCCN